MRKGREGEPQPQSASLTRDRPRRQVRCSSACACGRASCNALRAPSSTDAAAAAAAPAPAAPAALARCPGAAGAPDFQLLMIRDRRGQRSNSQCPAICDMGGAFGARGWRRGRCCVKIVSGVILSYFICTWIQGFFSSPQSALAAAEVGKQGFDPCCAFPCLHGGVCVSRGPHFECDCSSTGYSGRVCERPSWERWLRHTLLPCTQWLHQMPGRYPYLWSVVNMVPYLLRRANRLLYITRAHSLIQPAPFSTVNDYVTLDSYYNRTMYSRFLPPIPKNCPTEMGIHGPKQLPSPEEVFERIMKRRRFTPCDKGTNVYFISYAQFFTHQAFKTDYSRGPGGTFGNGEGIDASNVYGDPEDQRRALRSFKDGKLKVSVVDGEDVPPLLEDTPGLNMFYPKGKTVDEMMAGGLARKDRGVSPMWAMGHPAFSLTPTLFVVATLWLREHNRICDVLKAEHPDWDDERLYQTARLVVNGVMIKLTLTEYVQHLSQYKVKILYEPELLLGTDFQYQNRIYKEFIVLYMWHMLVPDILRIESDTLMYKDLLFTNNSEVFEYGFNRFLASMFINIAGKMTTRNHGSVVSYVGKSVVKHSRELRLQSFNNYRRAFGLPPYEDFMDLTGDPEIASELKKLYRDVNAVEFYIGMIAEKHTFSMTPPTMVVVGGSMAVKTLLSHPINSPGWWKPSTFGGRKTFEIIRRSTLRDFVCRNLRGSGCKKMHVSYSVPAPVLKAAQAHAEDIKRQCAESGEC